MKTQGSAAWQGGIKDGKGAISTRSGALKDYPYGFSSRFEGKPGTNPEELIGAAHAGCFTMALSLILGWRFVRSGGLEMLRAMEGATTPGHDMSHHDHHGHHHH